MQRAVLQLRQTDGRKNRDSAETETECIYKELMAVVPMEEDSDAPQPRPTANGSAEAGRLRDADPTVKVCLAPSVIVQQAAAEALGQRCGPILL